MNATEPMEIRKLAKEAAIRFDTTLLTTHPSEDGGNEWLIWMELPSGEEFWQYANPVKARSRTYVERWFRVAHERIIRGRSIR